MKQAEWQLFGIVASIIIISLLPIVFISCSDQQRNPVEPSTLPDVAALNSVADDESLECQIWKSLWAGAAQNDTEKGTLVGTVVVKNDPTDLYITYEMEPGYTLNEAHVYVGTSPPPKVAPGQFPYHSVPLSIPLSTFDAVEEGKLYIAAHAEVCTTSGCEGAWAGGDSDSDYTFIEEGISKKWGWYFPYLKSCDERARLKRTMADMRAIATALGTYFIDYDMYPQAQDSAGMFGTLDKYEGSTKDGWGNSYIYLAEDGDDYATKEECWAAQCGWLTEMESCDCGPVDYTLCSFGKDASVGGGGQFNPDIVFVNGQMQ